MAMKAPSSQMEISDAYVYNIGVSENLRVWLEDAKLLKITGNGKLTSEFVLPNNANSDTISATSHNGVLNVTVKKYPLSLGPRKTKSIDVKRI
ncbi:Alpha crystallin/Hsp20 domain [Macleaya cordata]|uniref:Alpha crystallin/Hsp20 domain n=1 Tax=Macleaya cordata TaxID=56857 RepID=A0A200R1E4_MACCD|nr:Alpha crystallin/Hsp20 domain [Macleaya cordata]